MCTYINENPAKSDSSGDNPDSVFQFEAGNSANALVNQVDDLQD